MAVKEQKLTNKYAVYCGDSNEVMKSFPENSIHFSIYSPPFGTANGGLYHYSSDPRDLSNCYDYSQFLEHYRFTIEEIHRLTMPGRFTAVHCTDVPSGNTGNDSIIDFPGDIINEHVRCRKEDCTESFYTRLKGLCGHGWFDLVARHIIWKEPLWVRTRTMAKVLEHRTIVEDSAEAGVASADYLLMFRKKGENKIPIAHPTGFEYYAGASSIPSDIQRFKNFKGDQKLNKYSHWIWRRYASSVWDDIRGGLGSFDDRNYMAVLPFKPEKERDEEKHVHPLQLDVIERAIILRSNPGEKILTPFMGVGSEIFGAIRLNRLGIGIELKPAYYYQAIKNLENAVAGPDINDQYSLNLE